MHYDIETSARLFWNSVSNVKATDRNRGTSRRRNGLSRLLVKQIQMPRLCYSEGVIHNLDRLFERFTSVRQRGEPIRRKLATSLEKGTNIAYKE